MMGTQPLGTSAQAGGRYPERGPLSGRSRGSPVSGCAEQLLLPATGPGGEASRSLGQDLPHIPLTPSCQERGKSAPAPERPDRGRNVNNLSGRSGTPAAVDGPPDHCASPAEMPALPPGPLEGASRKRGGEGGPGVQPPHS